MMAAAPERAAELRRRAASRARQQGRPDQAVEYLLELGAAHAEWSPVAALIHELAKGELARGRASRLLTWIGRLPEMIVDGEPLLHYYAARALRHVGQVRDSASRAERGIEVAAAARRWDVLYLLRACRAQMLAFLGRTDEAVAQVVELFDHFNRHPRSMEVRVRLEFDACITLGVTGRYREAISHGEAMLERQRSLKDAEERQQLCAFVHNALGNCHAYLGAIEAADTNYRAAERLWRQLDNVSQQAVVLNGIGRLRTRTGQFKEAQDAFERGIDLADGIGQMRLQVLLRNNLTRCQRERGALAEAEETIERSLPLARQIDEAYLLAEALEESGHVALLLGHNVEAIRSLEAAQAAAEEHWRAGLATCQALLSLAYARSGRVGEARQTLLAAEQALPLVRAAEDRLRCTVAMVAAQSAVGSTTALTELRAARRWARDNDRQDAFFADCARYRETARLLLGERRVPEAVMEILRHALADALPPIEAAPPPMLRAMPRVAANTAFEIRLFGTPGLLREGENITSWRTNLVRELLFFLAFRTGNVMRSEAIVEALMPEADFDRSLTALRHAVYHLRRLFAPHNPVRTATGGYCLEPEDGIRCDVIDFRSRAEAGRSGRGVVDVESLEEAVSLYRGNFLEGIDADWVLQPRAELERQFLVAAQSLLSEYERQGRHGAAVAVAERVLAVDPFHEPFHLALMRHQVALGHLAAARQHYRHYCRLMHDAFGRGPDPAVAELLSPTAG
jgi:DNA-binding SARP family transcriptional activator